jgi:coenzyme F420 hydrogenase subunit beta
LALLRSLGLKPEDVGHLRYRGNGWPGNFSVTLKGQSEPVQEISYRESWGYVQAFRPFSTHLCPDGSGEDADISCGDPWYRDVKAGEAGSSLVAVRTETGRRILKAATEAGYLSLKPVDPRRVIESQRNLVSKRGAIGGRIAMMRALGLPTPRLKGFSLFRNWIALSLNEQLRSTVGTLRRVLSRRYYRPVRREPGKELV